MNKFLNPENEKFFIDKQYIDGCPFCGNNEIEYFESEGKTGDKPTMSISTTCYGCHTVKYIALVPVNQYCDDFGKPLESQREKYAAIAIENWNERPRHGAERGTKQILPQ